MELIIREYDKTAHLPEKYIDLYIQAFPETERRNWKSNNDAESWLKSMTHVILCYYLTEICLLVSSISGSLFLTTDKKRKRLFMESIW